MHEKNTLKILSLDGHLIREYQNIREKELKIQREKMSNGIYFFQLFSDRRLIAVGKFIIE